MPRVYVLNSDPKDATLAVAFRAAGQDVISFLNPRDLVRAIRPQQPSLILIAGELRSPFVQQSLSALASDPKSREAPVVLLATAQEARFLKPFSRGLVELLKAPLDAPAAVKRLTALAGELAMRPNAVHGRSDKGELNAFLAELRLTQRTGKLIVNPKRPDEGSATFLRGQLQSAQAGEHKGQDGFNAILGGALLNWSFTELPPETADEEETITPEAVEDEPGLDFDFGGGGEPSDSGAPDFGGAIDLAGDDSSVAVVGGTGAIDLGLEKPAGEEDALELAEMVEEPSGPSKPPKVAEDLMSIEIDLGPPEEAAPPAPKAAPLAPKPAAAPPPTSAQPRAAVAAKQPPTSTPKAAQASPQPAAPAPKAGAPAPKTPAAPAQPAAAPAGPPQSLLLVDDDESLRNMFGLVLTKRGFKVTGAVDGLDGFEKASTRPFEVVVADLNMPRLDGWGLLRQLREDFATRELPVAFLSAHDDYRESLKALNAGAQAYLAKGVKHDVLAQQLRALLAPRDELRALLGKGQGELPAFKLDAVGAQWFLRALATAKATGVLRAGDGWAHYALFLDAGQLVYAVAQSGAHQLEGQRAVTAYVAARGAEASFIFGERAPQRTVNQPLEELLSEAVRVLNENERSAREAMMVKAKGIDVNPDLYAVYRQVAPEARLETARLLCEEKLSPGEVIARMELSPLEVEDTVRDLVRRGVVSLRA